MLRSLPLVATLALFALAGCRETITGPAPFTPPSPEPAPGLRSLYIKGLASLQVGDGTSYRAEPLPGVELSNYEWGFYGLGALALRPEPLEGLDRQVATEATRAGTVTLYVRAYDADGVAVAVGSRELTITAP